MFAYCGNNSVKCSDPSGKYFVLDLNDERDSERNTDTRTDFSNNTQTPPDYQTYRSEYESRNNNCYSYAIGYPHKTNPGFLSIIYAQNPIPQIKKVSSIYNKLCYSVDDIAQLVLDDMAAINCPCRIINSPQEATKGEKVIALKTGTYIFTLQQADYHFAILLSDGTWADKPGSYPVRRGVISGYDKTWPLAGISSDYYCSRTVYFAIGG